MTPDQEQEIRNWADGDGTFPPSFVGHREIVRALLKAIDVIAADTWHEAALIAKDKPGLGLTRLFNQKSIALLPPTKPAEAKP